MTDAIEFGPALALQAAIVTERAAVESAKLIGMGDEKAADQAAVDAMRDALNALPIRGRIVIGEGERDEAPMLYIGEEVGAGWAAKVGPEIDIALDPLEGTTLTAKGFPNALAVIAMAPKGGLLFAPDTYMDKIAIGPGYPAGTIDLDKSPKENAQAVAKAKGVKPSELTVCVLDRARHRDIISGLREIGARILLITDGDVQGVINTTDPDTGVDMYIGQGGAPEGVLAAAALKCVGGQMEGRLIFRNDEERGRAERIGIEDFDRKYNLDELASGDTVFAASGVTDGALVSGVKHAGGKVHTETLVMNSVDYAVQRLRSARPLD